MHQVYYASCRQTLPCVKNQPCKDRVQLSLIVYRKHNQDLVRLHSLCVDFTTMTNVQYRSMRIDSGIDFSTIPHDLPPWQDLGSSLEQKGNLTEIRTYMSHSCSLVIPSGSNAGFLANIFTRDNRAVPRGVVSLKSMKYQICANTPWLLLNPVYDFGNFHWSMSRFIDANHTGHISPTFCYVIPQVYSSYLCLAPLDFTHTYGILYYAIIQNTDS
jgi:hypothetical protein